MKRIKAYIRMNRLEDVKLALEDQGILGISVEEVRGFGRQQGQTEMYRGSSYALNLVPKMKLDVVVKDDQVEAAVEAIIEGAKTGELGDGKIFVSEVLDVVRVRTGERGEAALE